MKIVLTEANKSTKRAGVQWCCARAEFELL